MRDKYIYIKRKRENLNFFIVLMSEQFFTIIDEYCSFINFFFHQIGEVVRDSF
jgi:hypothetical protein